MPPRVYIPVTVHDESERPRSPRGLGAVVHAGLMSADDGPPEWREVAETAVAHIKYRARDVPPPALVASPRDAPEVVAMREDELRVGADESRGSRSGEFLLFPYGQLD